MPYWYWKCIVYQFQYTRLISIINLLISHQGSCNDPFVPHTRLCLQAGLSGLNASKNSWFRAWPRYLWICVSASDYFVWKMKQCLEKFKILYYQKGNVKLFNFTQHFAFDLYWSVTFCPIKTFIKDVHFGAEQIPFAHFSVPQHMNSLTRTPRSLFALHSSPQCSHHTVTGYMFLRSTLSLSGGRSYIIYPTLMLWRAECEATRSCTGCCSINQFTGFVRMRGNAGARE